MTRNVPLHFLSQPYRGLHDPLVSKFSLAISRSGGKTQVIIQKHQTKLEVFKPFHCGGSDRGPRMVIFTKEIKQTQASQRTSKDPWKWKGENIIQEVYMLRQPVYNLYWKERKDKKTSSWHPKLSNYWDLVNDANERRRPNECVCVAGGYKQGQERASPVTDR